MGATWKWEQTLACLSKKDIVLFWVASTPWKLHNTRATPDSDPCSKLTQKVTSKMQKEIMSRWTQKRNKVSWASDSGDYQFLSVALEWWVCRHENGGMWYKEKKRGTNAIIIIILHEITASNKKYFWPKNDQWHCKIHKWYGVLGGTFYLYI